MLKNKRNTWTLLKEDILQFWKIDLLALTSFMIQVHQSQMTIILWWNSKVKWISKSLWSKFLKLHKKTCLLHKILNMMKVNSYSIKKNDISWKLYHQYNIISYKMARNCEKAQGMLNRWWMMKRCLVNKEDDERPKGLRHIR